MADAEVSCEGGARLPPKRPTIIRPASAAVSDEKGPVPQRPAPARPAPPPPGGKPQPTAARPLTADAGSLLHMGAPPPRPSAVPPSSAPSKLPGPPSPAPANRPDPPASTPGKSATKTQGSVKKRPEITIVDVRPMSQAGFKDLKVQSSLTGGSQKPAVNTSMPDSQGNTAVLPGRPNPVPQPPPPTPGSRPAIPPIVPATPHPASPLFTPPMPQSTPQPLNSTQDSSDTAPKPARPTILRLTRPKSTIDSTEKSKQDSTTTSPPPLPKRSPMDGPPPKPARLAHATAVVQAEEKNAAESEEKAEERVMPKKPTRISIIRPPLKRKSDVDDVDGGAEVEMKNLQNDAEDEPTTHVTPQTRPPPPPSRPAAPVVTNPQDTSPGVSHPGVASHAISAPPVPTTRPKGGPHDQASSPTNRRVSDSSAVQEDDNPLVHAAAGTVNSGSGSMHNELKQPPHPLMRPPPVPAARPQVSHPMGHPRSDASVSAKPQPPAATRASVSSVHDASALSKPDHGLPAPLVPSKPPPPATMPESSADVAQPSRPPPPVPGTRPQPPPHPATRPLPSVPSPDSEVSSPTGHVYEEVEVTRNQQHVHDVPQTEGASSTHREELFKTKQSASMDSPSSTETESDISTMYAKVNKPHRHTDHSDVDSQPGSAANPFGVQLKHVPPDAFQESEQPQQLAQHSTEDNGGADRKPSVTAPKPAVLSKPQPAAKPRPATAQTATPGQRATSPMEQPSSPIKQPSFPFKTPSNAPQLPDKSDAIAAAKPNPAAKRPTIIRPSPKSADNEDADKSEELETGSVEMCRMGPAVSPRPQSLAEPSRESTEERFKSEPPVPVKRPVTIIGFPHRQKTQEESAKSATGAVLKTEGQETLPPVPRQRTSPPVDRSDLPSAEKKSDTTVLVTRPPPPRPDNRPLKISDQSAELSESSPPRAKSGSEPTSPRPSSPAPPRPTNRPPPAREVASGAGVESVSSVHSTPRYAPPIKRKEHNAEHETDMRSKPSSDPSGPPPRPVSIQVKPPVSPAAVATSSGKEAKGEKLARRQPARPAPAKDVKQSLPPLPHRPGMSHPLYGYMMSQPHAIALYDYPANHPDELPFQEGDAVVLLERVDDQWLMGRVGDKEGQFPQNFVHIIHPLHDELPSSAIDEIIDNVFEDILQEGNHVQRANFPQEKPDNLTGPRCRARFDFDGEGVGDLAFEDGDVIQLLAHCGNDWLRGQLGERVGMFPASFVEIIEDLPEGKGQGAVASAVGSDEMVALFDFDGEAGELSFQAGDKIKVLSKVNDQWLFGKCNGKEGSFPASFIDNIPDNLPLHVPSTPTKKSSTFHAEPKSYGIAIYNFEGEQDGDLGFKEGDRIEIVEHVGQDWLKGRLRGKEGSFPATFVQLDTEECSGAGDMDVPDHGTGLDTHAGLVCGVALFDFTGEAEGELNFKAGDEIILGSLVSEGSEWQWGEVHGKKGIFPAAFVDML